MRYVIHQAGTGRILRHGVCPEEDAALQEVPDAHALLTLPDAHPPIDDTAHRVEAGAIVERAAEPVDPVAAGRSLRLQRDHRLAASDWTQLADAPLSVADRAAWASYRQALRDLPANSPDPAKPVWPQAPRKE
ncbi:MAG: hypothetical protein JWO51_2435 [Rhodospirillales bacterium]|nr:hypothetical protein [Rhodospirillales bacterium]